MSYCTEPEARFVGACMHVSIGTRTQPAEICLCLRRAGNTSWAAEICLCPTSREQQLGGMPFDSTFKIMRSSDDDAGSEDAFSEDM
jgi:hypothetical protein